MAAHPCGFRMLTHPLAIQGYISSSHAFLTGRRHLNEDKLSSKTKK